MTTYYSITTGCVIIMTTYYDYLINKETTMSGLKRKREPENIVVTKKSKKRLRRL